MFRSLMLAGGGIKAGYQAGCLQVLLDEVSSGKLHFDHIDAASAGCFNAAMICSGKSGTEIANAWRDINPLDFVSLNLPELRKGPWARSFGTFDGLRDKVFVDWGLDFEKIRAWNQSEVTFNYFDFTTKEIGVILNSALDVDYLCASVALIGWFPPIIKNGHTLVDAVFATDSNLSEAEKRHATELWAIWSVAKLGEIRNGIIAQYFHILEQSADANFFAGWHRLQNSGVTTHLLRQEVPIHYLFNFSRDRMAATVDLGIRDMREYCQAQGLLPNVYAFSGAPQTPVPSKFASVRFTEKLDGFYFVKNGDRFETQPLAFRLTVATGELDTFTRQPEHLTHVVSGIVEAPELGGTRTVTDGSLGILVDVRASDGVIVPGDKRMSYELRFRTADGKPFLLIGTKYVIDGLGKNLWRDTTTAYVTLYELDDTNPSVRRFHGAGIVTLSLRGFAAQLMSFRVGGTSNPLMAVGALRRFGQFFLRQCWDVYARNALDYAPF